MSRSSPYSKEFRDVAVWLVAESGRPFSEIARDLGITADTLATWVKRDALEKAAWMLEAKERTELAELCRRVRTLEAERDIPKEAAAFVARESDRTRERVPASSSATSRQWGCRIRRAAPLRGPRRQSD